MEWHEQSATGKKLEEMLDTKARMACACAQLNQAAYALEQAQFNLIYKETSEYRKKIWDLRDEIEEMVNAIVDKQAALRVEFRRTAAKED